MLDNLDSYWSSLIAGHALKYSDFMSLCDKAIEILVEEPNVLDIESPLWICGDIHGQFHDLLTILRITTAPERKLLLLGDYVDRGRHSVLTLSLLFLLKIKYPGQIFLLRGNHECRQITQVYGFYDECFFYYNNAEIWKKACLVFDYLPVAAIIEGRIFAIHGGLSPSFGNIDYIRKFERAMEIPANGPFSDILWSDPDESEKSLWSISPRGAGYLFNGQVAMEFNWLNGIELICRAHQLVNEGFRFVFKEKSLLTIWSAPNYCYRCGNLASVLKIDRHQTVAEDSFILFNSKTIEKTNYNLENSHPNKIFFV